MNGAHALIRTLVDGGVDVCFTNPGTSEMHFVAAVDDIAEMRTVLCLFEGVATGAADGFARMADRPAATLLHLGPGMANGMANLHNARRARVPMINIVGDHATYHKQYDAPLESDIDAAAGTFSFVERPLRTADLAGAAASAIARATRPPYEIATLVLPADVSWGEDAEPAVVPPPAPGATVTDDEIAQVAKALGSGEPCLLLLGGRANREGPLRDASRIVAATGAKMLTEVFPTRLTRGAGVPAIERLQYLAEFAEMQLQGTKHLILVDAVSPVSFFAYPGKASDLLPDGCEVHVLATAASEAGDALARLAERVAAGVDPVLAPADRPGRPSGPLTGETVAQAVGALLPEGAVVVDEAATSGLWAGGATAGAPKHDWLTLTGGAIGIGLPLSVGAAVAAPDRPVINLQADGSAMYTIQALWTMAREGLDVTTVLFNNRSYAILNMELQRVGARVGPKALDMLDLSRPDLSFVSLAQGMGVDAVAVSTAEDFTAALERSLREPGPHLIEAVL
ncbi:MAG TPA: acetolactate synthase large subunit [Acidimicrobiales bacterium]|nr:acetolactate synthase large subunit [Acidimicrobiales bacterium]